MVSGSDSRSEPSQLSDRDLVESVLRDLSEAADKWEALVTQAETVTYSVDLGDVRAVANSDGRLLELTLHPGVMTGYAHGELADRVNLAITALRDEVEAENRARYGGRLQGHRYLRGSSHLLARHFGAGRKAHSRAVATLKADIQAWHPAGIQTPKPRCESDVFARIGHTSHPSTRKSRVGPGASEAPLA
ncbi:transposase [Mycobacterium tuberculosis]|nr:transposase [Mycobacterium tuberculosis]